LSCCDRGCPGFLRSFPTRRSSDLFLGTLTGLPDARRWSRAVEKLPCSRRLAEQLVLASFDRKGGHELILAMPLDAFDDLPAPIRSEEHTSELQSRENLVCRLLLEK